MFILLLFYYWLLVSASKGHHQANIYDKPKMLVHILQKRHLYGIPFTIISSLYNYYQPHNIKSQQNLLQTAHLKVGNNCKDY